ncbi:NifB/NifX family molybdenum-iron cluster-binding protein [Labilibaculum sp. K2S]|uniref:NifB/NifX family molybdenum-iron cluster-binding protein n=1 Tax=Labilibaculum sp. K2S TaxID=3056386 RepID=UPI0025A49F91|nr:NifB/NifX family molybdenum-iron cluster-binding protein [Labilibaculum sp. K2S]MDM8158565.1 NifB/NifX family molybdenum-iron cluster-binding protein [Labilibaculum sp. K2S]
MKKKIAVPVKDGILDGHFGHCSHFALLDVEDKAIVTEELVVAPPHEPGLLPPFLADLGVTDVIAGGMGNRAIQIFNQHNVNVFVGAPQLDAKELVKGFLDESLSFTANYCDH